MSLALWFLGLGALLVVVALVASVLRHLPFTTTMIYLLVGLGLGPIGLGVAGLDPLARSALMERVTEIAVIVSLFTAGLKLRVPVRDPLWRLPFRLASLSMVATVGLIALVGHWWLGMPLGAAVLLGGVLAPTDPVLASDVQLTHPGDRTRLRFGLTGEASLNDGTAFPFVMLGLGLLGLHDLGEAGLRWLAVDVIWAVAAGLGVGFGLGTAVGQLVLFLRREHKEGFGLDDFLALGLIGAAYGAALLLHAYGFLAVFAAGLALRRIERRSSGRDEPEEVHEMAAAGRAEEIATHPEKAPAYMAQAVLGFNEQMERLLEVGVVLLLGMMLSDPYLEADALWFVPLLMLVVRPLAAFAGLVGSGLPLIEKALIGWFGVRGVGSVYYLMYALQHGVPESLARSLVGLTLTAVAASIFAHGLTVTPLMRLYERRLDQSSKSTRRIDSQGT